MIRCSMLLTLRLEVMFRYNCFIAVISTSEYMYSTYTDLGDYVRSSSYDGYYPVG